MMFNILRFYLFQIFRASFYRHFLAALTGLCLCSYVSADSIKDGFCVSFCGARDQLNIHTLTPINQLNDDELFLAAEAMRENRMPSVQRHLNLLWLEESPETTIEGSRVWLRLLRHSLSLYKPTSTQSTLYTKAMYYLDDSILDGAGYQFKLSSHSVRIVFNYTF